jgi:AcrR family transcriptional regulator
MGYVHSRDEILAAAVEVVGSSGLAGLTFRAVSRRLEIADRTVVYYFPSKDDLVLAVLARTGEQLQALLENALGKAPVAGPVLLQRLWPALTTPAGDAAFRLYFETVGLAARGREPYRSAAAQLADVWTAWVAERLDGDPGSRGDRAAALVAVVDGLLLLRAVSGPDTAAAAVRGLALT